MRMVARIAMAAVLTLSGGMPALAAEDLDTLNRQVVQLYRQGKHGEALAIAEKAIALAERTLGPSHPNTLTSVNNLAAVYQAQGCFAEAEPLLKRGLADNEAVLGVAHEDTLTSVNDLARLYQARGRLGEADAGRL